MDEEQQSINTPVEVENNSTEATPVEQEATLDVKPEVSDQTPEPAKGEKQLSGAEKRIHQLVDERDELKKKAETLEQKLTEYTGQFQTEPTSGYAEQQPSFGASQGEEREMTPSELRALVRLEIDQEKNLNRINNEAKEAMILHPELDPNSDKFDAELSDAVTESVLLAVKNNPNISVKEIANRYMKPFKKAADKAVGQERENIVQQVNDQALRPSTVKAVDKKFEEKSIKEMEAELGIVY